MSCPNCKTKIDLSWRFCAECRAYLTTDIDSQKSPQASGSTSSSPYYDLQNHDFGSDSVDDAILLSNEDGVKEFKKILKESGFDAFIESVYKANNKWKDVEINIAIAGESGTGKSTLINALRNLKADEDGAAKIGCTETTKEPTPYPYRDNGNVKVWDLPGVGTPNFPKATYLDEIEIERYDFILLVSCTRYKENDTWLAKHIKSRHPDVNLCFIRTKVDSDLENFAEGHRKPLLAEERNKEFKKIRDDCNDNLKKAGIDTFEMFLINSYAPYEFDFGKLVNMLINKVTEFKRDAMILTLSAVTNEIVEQKIRILGEDLVAASIAAALTAKRSTREHNYLDVLMWEGKKYQQQLGIDAHSIDVLERRLKKQLNMQSHAILRTPEHFAKFYDNYEKFRPSDPSSVFEKIVNKILRFRKRRRKYASFLNFLLNMCAAETYTLHRNLAIWINE